MTWDEYFIRHALLAAEKSRDRSTRCGAVIVGPDRQLLSHGYNGFPRQVNDDDEGRHQRPTKYQWTEHAERNAIYNAARHGIALRGCTLYMNWEPFPCPDCARGIIQAGLVEVVGPSRTFPGSRETINWTERFKVTRVMLSEAGVQTRTVSWAEERGEGEG